MIRFIVMVLGLTSIGCQAHVFSPPAVAGPAETATVLSEGESRLGFNFSGQGELFGPSVTGYSLRFRQGVGAEFEVGADMTLAYVDPGVERADKDLSPYFGTARMGAKWAVVPGFVGLAGGVGIGLSDAGQFASPDLGLVLAAENRIVVPFVNVSGFVSQPMNAKEVDLSTADEGLNTNRQTPQFSYGVLWSLGVRRAFPVGGVRLAPHLGFAGTFISDSEEQAHLVGLVSGLAVEF